MSMITEKTAFDSAYPIPASLANHLSIEGKRAFAEDFVRVRDEVETEYYAEVDRVVSGATRTRQFLGALFRPAIGRKVKDAEQFYQTYGRLMRWAWLSISIGIYDDGIHAITDPAGRLHTAQVNTVDTAWQAALACAPEDGLFVEVGTGRGNSIARLAQLRPRARVISITISPEQAQIAGKIAQKLGASNVEIRRGDIFDPAVTQDLQGQADAVTAIEVTGHFPHDMKAKGIAMLAAMLKAGAPLTLMDSALPKPINPMLESYYTNQSWYFGKREMYLNGYEAASVTPTGYLDYSQNTLQTFIDSTTVLRAHRPQLRQEFGFIMAAMWPELPKAVYLPTVKQIEYAHVVGVKN
jgi:cyclopropane fatty-acyl-phospholipid synthase-like methyltransferase